jgi:YidC/Oxa1 family membrane protein insertase
MDKNTIIGLIIIFGIFIGWSIWMSPSQEEIAKRQHVQDSIASIQQKADDSLAKAAEVSRTQVSSETSVKLTTLPQNENERDSVKRVLKDQLGFFSESAVGQDDYYTIESDLIKLTLSSKGGRPYIVNLKKYKTFDTLPVILFDSLKARFGLEFFAGKRNINTNDLYFKPVFYSKKDEGQKTLVVSGDETIKFGMRLYVDANDSSKVSDKYVEFLYTIKGNNYMLGYDIKLHGLADVIESNTTFVNLVWNADLRRQEKSLDNEKNESTVFYRYAKDDAVDYLNETDDDKKALSTSVKWISYKSKFFLAALIAKESFEGADISTFDKVAEKDNPRYLESMSAVIPLEYSTTQDADYSMQMYFGPNKYKTLKKYDLKLERQVLLGWSFFLMWGINVYAVLPVFDWLSSYDLNYGIIILILTILLKIVLFPIAYISYKSTAKMRVLKPEIDELAKKYPKKEEGMKKQQATMELYKKAGVNPMAGCIPMLLQFPILIAMFRFFPASIELRQEPFLWAHDLSSYDSILNLPFDIPFYGDHVSLFTLLMTISTLIYTKMNNDMMGTGTQQMPGMKTMMYIMPIMFLGIFNNYSSGLSYYYFLANVITFAQMYIIRRTINEDKLHAQIQENRKKTFKKSSFQKRLEDMAKQKGYKP